MILVMNVLELITKHSSPFFCAKKLGLSLEMNQFVEINYDFLFSWHKRMGVKY